MSDEKPNIETGEHLECPDPDVIIAALRSELAASKAASNKAKSMLGDAMDELARLRAQEGLAGRLKRKLFLAESERDALRDIARRWMKLSVMAYPLGARDQLAADTRKAIGEAE